MDFLKAEAQGQSLNNQLQVMKSLKEIVTSIFQDLIREKDGEVYMWVSHYESIHCKFEIVVM